MKTTAELKKELKALQELKIDTQKDIDNFEVNPYDYEDQYCEAIDEGGPVRIGSLEYTASYVLREIDPIAYRCGLNDYVDGIDREEVDAYKELTEALESIEGKIEDIESEIEDIEAEG